MKLQLALNIQPAPKFHRFRCAPKFQALCVCVPRRLCAPCVFLSCPVLCALLLITSRKMTIYAPDDLFQIERIETTSLNDLHSMKPLKVGQISHYGKWERPPHKDFFSLLSFLSFVFTFKCLISNYDGFVFCCTQT